MDQESEIKNMLCYVMLYIYIYVQFNWYILRTVIIGTIRTITGRFFKFVSFTSTNMKGEAHISCNLCDLYLWVGWQVDSVSDYGHLWDGGNPELTA